MTKTKTMKLSHNLGGSFIALIFSLFFFQMDSSAESMTYLWVVDGTIENSLVGAGDCTPFKDGVNFVNRVWQVAVIQVVSDAKPV
jgi:hypothetical protein